jgi:tetratricopeptide (TPR) repeat protein
MICMNCGAEAGSESVCSNCGWDLNVQNKAVQLSNMYYNQGLDKAQIRDMSGAIDLLERSLKFNKRNIDARNLLGLVYFETGEVVAALSEWIISKNIMPEDNIASEYIDRVQANPNRLETIQQTIKRYNRALNACRAGEYDVAVIMLKKVVAANPKLIKAYYLLSLLYMKQGDYEKARKVLKKAAPIDRTNATSLRFFKEIDEQTGTTTDRESLTKGVVKEKRKGIYKILDHFKLPEKKVVTDYSYMTKNWDDEEKIITEPVIQPVAFHQVPAFLSLLNMIIGIVLGALVVGVIVIPSINRNLSRDAETKVAQYSSAMVTQNEHIKELESKIEEYDSMVDSGNMQISEASKAIEYYEKLLNAYIAYAAQNYDLALETLQGVDTSVYSENALNIYNGIVSDINSKQYDSYNAQAMEAFQRGDYKDAITYFAAAKNVNPDSYSACAYLAHSYRLNQQSSEAINAFQDIVNKYPNTERAAKASEYITNIQKGDFSPEIGIAQVNQEVAVGELENVDTPETADAQQ